MEGTFYQLSTLLFFLWHLSVDALFYPGLVSLAQIWAETVASDLMSLVSAEVWTRHDWYHQQS